jgi:protein-L-isoaspartate O-methyltransferase
MLILKSVKSRINVKPSDVKRELLDEQAPKLLQELHLLTRDGALNADARRKLKQVNHLVNLISPALNDVLERFEEPILIDVGAGKAYLGFILYQLYLQNKGSVISVENREELVKKGESMAERMDFRRMKFIHSSIASFQAPERVHLVTALHACDTATDEALILAIKSKADHIAVVPCCQAEVAELLRKEKNSSLQMLWENGIHRREFGSHFTNVIRALVLETFGYQVTVTELVGWEHSLKNELILGKKVQNINSSAKDKLASLLEKINVKPLLVRQLLPEL